MQPNISHSSRSFDLRRQNNKIALKKVRPKTWSHQDDLTDLVGKKIFVTNIRGDEYFGTLLAADQFTLKVKPDYAQAKIVVIFKSALIDFGEF